MMHVDQKYNIRRCARCGSDHDQLLFRPFSVPVTDSDGTLWTRWGICPKTGEPILMKHFEPGDEQKYTAEKLSHNAVVSGS